MDELYIDWVRPFLYRSFKDKNYAAIADPLLNGAYNHDEMERMVACAASCIQLDAKQRPPMSLIVLILEGEVPVNALNLDMSISSSSSEGHDFLSQRSGNSRCTYSEYSGTTSKKFTGSSLEGHAEEESLYH